MIQGETGLEIQSRPGSPAGEFMGGAWPVIALADEEFTVSAERRRDNVLWLINGQLVASSPDIRPRGTPTITFMASGPDLAGATVDDVMVWYKLPR
jgi:hypothetical protein